METYKLELLISINTTDLVYKLDTLNYVVNSLTRNTIIQFDSVDGNISASIIIEECTDDIKWYYYRIFNSLVWKNENGKTFSYITHKINDKVID